jgi:hypothetical protein
MKLAHYLAEQKAKPEQQIGVKTAVIFSMGIHEFIAI